MHADADDYSMRLKTSQRRRERANNNAECVCMRPALTLLKPKKRRKRSGVRAGCSLTNTMRRAQKLQSSTGASEAGDVDAAECGSVRMRKAGRAGRSERALLTSLSAAGERNSRMGWACHDVVCPCRCK